MTKMSYSSRSCRLGVSCLTQYICRNGLRRKVNNWRHLENPTISIQKIHVDNNKSYLYYKFDFTSNTTLTWISIAEVKLFGSKSEIP